MTSNSLNDLKKIKRKFNNKEVKNSKNILEKDKLRSSDNGSLSAKFATGSQGTGEIQSKREQSVRKRIKTNVEMTIKKFKKDLKSPF